MPADDAALTSQDRALLARLGELTAAEAQLPPEVAAAAKGLHDWARVDALLAEFVDDEVLTRGDGAAYTYAAGTAAIRAEIEPAGYRRRRLVVLAEDGTTVADRVEVQRGDGRTDRLRADRFGEHSADLPTGPVRVLAHFPSGAVVTPWFTL